MWSFDREGECDERLKGNRNEVMGIDTERKRAERQDLMPLAHPQRGVDAMAGQFEGPTEPVPGVVDVAAPGA